MSSEEEYSGLKEETIENADTSMENDGQEVSRKRKGQDLAIQKVIAQANEQSSSGEDENEGSEESYASTDSEVIVQKKAKTPKRKSSTKKKEEVKSEKIFCSRAPLKLRKARTRIVLIKTKYESRASDKYFTAQYGRRTVTSDKTLSSLKSAKMDPQTLRNQIGNAPLSHEKERNDLFTSYTAKFEKWMFQLRNGFNCLLYGFGSKAKLMDRFRKECLQTENHIVVNGFFPGLTIKQILNMISEDVLNHTGTFKSVIDQAAFIKHEFDVDRSDDAKELFLLVYNIDGAMLRSSKAQDAFSFLASATKIHILASIDHINAPLIWDQTANSRFNWLWYNVTTFEPYLKEMSFENSFLIQQSASLALSSLIHVIRSLTPNAKGIFVLLANYLLDNENNGAFTGMSFNDLYQKCRERFLVSSDLTLRAQLTEFRDHKLIKSKKGQDGIEYLTIPLDSTSLRSFLEEETS